MYCIRGSMIPKLLLPLSFESKKKTREWSHGAWPSLRQIAVNLYREWRIRDVIRMVAQNLGAESSVKTAGGRHHQSALSEGSGHFSTLSALIKHQTLSLCRINLVKPLLLSQKWRRDALRRIRHDSLSPWSIGACNYVGHGHFRIFSPFFFS